MSALLKEIAVLARKTKQVYVATANQKGMPHITSAGRFMLQDSEKVAIREWFCPQTISNLEKNSLISIVVWDADTDTGYQISGKVEAIDDLAILDGYIEQESLRPSPQVDRSLLIQVGKIFKFSRQPHSDEPLSVIKGELDD